MNNYYLLVLIFIISSCKPNISEKTSHLNPPDWSSNQIWYQIFVERFYNGDTTNDPTTKNIYASSNFQSAPNNWSLTPWTSNWYQTDQWADEIDGNFHSKIQLRRYGGDLQGVLNKLDYLQELGIRSEERRVGKECRSRWSPYH